MPDTALDLFSPSERKLTADMTSKRTESGKVILGIQRWYTLMQTEGIPLEKHKKKIILKLLFSDKPY